MNMDSAKLLVSVPDEAFRESHGEIPAGVEMAVWDMRSGWERNEVLDIVVLPYQRADQPAISAECPATSNPDADHWL